MKMMKTYDIHFGQLNNNSYGIIKSEINNTIKETNRKSHISWVFKYDWIHNLVYFKFINKIYAQHINQFNFKYKYQVLYTPQHIFELTLDPINSLIFWSEGLDDNSIAAKIYKANQDGSNRTLLMEVSSGYNPYGLSVDFQNRVLFWFQYKYQSNIFD